MASPLTNLAVRLLRRFARRTCRDDRGQALVEAAIVMPLMTFLILGILQLTMMQHARVMTEYAAFNAARAGIVWNADSAIMESAAIISLLPTYDGLSGEHGLGNPMKFLKNIAQRALLYQKSKRLPQAIDLMKKGAGKVISSLPLIGQKGKNWLSGQKDQILDAAEKAANDAAVKALQKALGGADMRFVMVKILNPTTGSFGQRGKEITFDDPANRDVTRLSIQVRYLYMMRVPFANMIIHQAWLAGQAGKQLYGAIWNPQEYAGETGFRSDHPLTASSFFDPVMAALSKLASQGVYMVPIKTTYTMRMQSNPYRTSLEMN